MNTIEFNIIVFFISFLVGSVLMCFFYYKIENAIENRRKLKLKKLYPALFEPWQCDQFKATHPVATGIYKI